MEHYKAQKKSKERQKEQTVTSLLELGESKRLSTDLPEDDEEEDPFSTDSGEEWQEVKDAEHKEPSLSLIPKQGVQITVEMPGIMRKKKGFDLMASIKRRINRVKKENQVYIHKVHLLCWIAHGNYVSSVLGSQMLMGVALSLLPSQQAFPSGKFDILDGNDTTVYY